MEKLLRSRRRINLAIIVLLIMAFSVLLPVYANEQPLTQDEVFMISRNVGNKYGISPELLTAIAFKESSYIPDAQNGICKGLMQVSEKWHKDRMEKLEVNDLYDPYANMLVAADYLLELFERYYDVGMVLMVYNGDSSAYDYYYGYAELSEYAIDILNMAQEMEEKNDSRN